MRGRYLIVCAISSLLCACQLQARTEKASFYGYHRLFLHGIPEGNDAFSRGWRDGCDTLLSVSGVGALHLVPQQVNGYLLAEEERYRKGYEIGASYCANFLDYN